MYDEVVVPLDGSDAAAGALRAAATIATALNVPVRMVGFHLPNEDGGDLRARLRTQAEQLGPTRRTIETGVAHWSVADHIESVLQASPQALCVMSTHGRGRSAGMVGSVALDLSGAIDRPLLLVGPSFAPTRFRMHGPAVVAADGSERDDATLNAVADFVRTFDYTPHVAQVLPKSTGGTTRRSDLPAESAGAARVARQLDALVGDAGNRAEFEVLHGNPATALLDYVDAIRATVVVMTSRGEAGLDRVRHGSVTADIIRHSSCPVLVAATTGSSESPDLQSSSTDRATE